MGAAKAICDSIREHPEAWSMGQHTFDRKDGIKIWHCNGLFCIKMYQPNKMCYGVIGTIRVWLMIRKWMEWDACRLANNEYEKKENK